MSELQHLLEWIFGSFWRWLGMVILIGAVTTSALHLLAAIGLAAWGRGNGK